MLGWLRNMVRRACWDGVQQFASDIGATPEEAAELLTHRRQAEDGKLAHAQVPPDPVRALLSPRQNGTRTKAKI